MNLPMNDWNGETTLIWGHLKEHKMPTLREAYNNIKDDNETQLDRLGIPIKKSVILAEAMQGIVVSEDLQNEGTDLLNDLLDIALSNVHWRCLAYAVMELIEYEDSIVEDE